jgi:hypothetical protein
MNLSRRHVLEHVAAVVCLPHELRRPSPSFGLERPYLKRLVFILSFQLLIVAVVIFIISEQRRARVSDTGGHAQADGSSDNR